MRCFGTKEKEELLTLSTLGIQGTLSTLNVIRENPLDPCHLRSIYLKLKSLRRVLMEKWLLVPAK